MLLNISMLIRDTRNFALVSQSELCSSKDKRGEIGGNEANNDYKYTKSTLSPYLQY